MGTLLQMRGFTDEERTRIESELIDTAQRLFTRHGFQKTTIQDITESVGIAEGTFYRFFDSKSDVYLRVLLREQDELIDTIETELAESRNPREQIERLFRAWADEFERRPLLLRSHQDTQTLMRSVDTAASAEAKEHIIERMAPLIQDIQDRSDGFISELTPQQVFELLSMVELVASHKEAHDRLGWSGYDSFKELLITVLTGGLASAHSDE